MAASQVTGRQVMVMRPVLATIYCSAGATGEYVATSDTIGHPLTASASGWHQHANALAESRCEVHLM